MTPNNPFFVFLFACFFLLYWAIPAGRRSGLLVAASLGYIFWLDAVALYVVLGVSIIGYVAGIGMARGLGMARRVWCVIGVVAGLLPLLYWKYGAMLGDLLFWIVPLRTGSATLLVGGLVPLGLSFFTFRVLSYMIDVNRGTVPAVMYPTEFLAYMTYFPQFLAGPIQRPADFLNDLRGRTHLMPEEAAEGIGSVLSGLIKKVVVADALSGYITVRFSNVNDAPSAELIIASYLFALQLYFDFSGYTDMANGFSRMLGFKPVANFRTPYFSRSVGEFWSRWHITLMSWFRDYLYIPLGGNRCGKWRHGLNLLIVFGLCGLWHGTGMNYLVWGLLNGVFLILALSFGESREMRKQVAGGDSFLPAPGNLLKMLFVFHLILVTWVFFRSSSVGDGLTILQRATSWEVWLGVWQNLPINLCAMAAALLIVEWFQRRRGHVLECGKPMSVLRWTVYLGAACIILVFGSFKHVPFIYFQF